MAAIDKRVSENKVAAYQCGWRPVSECLFIKKVGLST